MKMKIYIHTLFFVFTVLFVAIGCKDDQKESAPTLKVQAEDLWMVSENGGVFQLNIESNAQWSVSSEADWLQITPANGRGNAICEVHIDSSYLYNERSSAIKVDMGVGATTSLPVSQAGYQKKISIKESVVEVPDYAVYGENIVKAEVKANVPFSIKILGNATWVKLKNYKQNEVVSIPRATIVDIEYEINDKAIARSVEIEFSSTEAGVQKTILKITQLAPAPVEIGRKGDSLAVLAIARNINNDLSWDPSRSMKQWSCVTLHPNGRVKTLEMLSFDTKRTLPYQVKYLTELEEFYLMGNSNAFLKRIPLGPEICELKKLKKLSLISYGFNILPKNFENMESLEYLDLSGNTFAKVPVDQLRTLIKKYDKLRHINFSNNRMWDGVNDLSIYYKDSLGLTGRFPVELFSQDFDSLQTISLSYNYFDGDLPRDEELMTPGRTEIMPKLKKFAANLNRLSGEIPHWIFKTRDEKHEFINKWDPFILVFQQEGIGPMHSHLEGAANCSHTHKGTPEHIAKFHSGDAKNPAAHKAGFSNEPSAADVFYKKP